jgi:protein-histidine pros-kinase
MNGLTTNGIVRVVLITSFLFALVIGTGGFYYILHKRAVEQTAVEARRLLTTATAIRSYTDTYIGPNFLTLSPDKFHEASVPAFAAQTVYQRVQESYPGYTYREPALNPTNPGDRPTPVEVELINRFRNDPKLKEIQGVREDANGAAVYYLARPITITQERCLVCHDTPARAPPAMLAKYGPSNGFGWQMNETIGIQSLTVPAAQELKETGEIAMILAGGLLILFTLTYFALTLPLDVLLVRPLRALAQASESASTSTGSRIPIPDSGTAEIRSIAVAVERLRLSLAKALSRLSAAERSKDS